MTGNPPTFAPMLGIARPYRSRGGQLHDVGDGRKLTARMITFESGCEVSAIYARIQRGVAGAELLKPNGVKLYDVGGGERMTLKQIMRRTGLSEAAVRSRVSRGVKGKALLRKERRNLAAPRSSTMVVALRLADAYPDRLPTTREIRRIYPMVEQTAERWLAAMRAARERITTAT